jgi:hypothetical protein
MGAIHLRYQMLQPYLLKQKEGSNWYMISFKRLLNVVIHNSIIYWFMPNNKGTDPLKFRILVILDIVKKHGSAVPHPAYGSPSTKPPPERLT